MQWRLGGSRDGAWQSATFTAEDPAAAEQLAGLAKVLVESRGHRLTRDEVYARVLDDGPKAQSALTLAKWVKLWAEDRKPVRPDHPGVDEIQEDTLAGYLGVLKLRVLPFMGHMLLSEIDEDTIRDWVKWLKATRVRRTKANPTGRPISAQSVRRAHGVLHQVLGAAVPKHIPYNPAARPHGTRKNRVGLPKVIPFEGMFLTPYEVDLIYANCDASVKDLWFLLVRTGLRLGEALVLRVQDVTLDGAHPEIRVRRALKKGQRIGLPKSSKSRREVSISAAVVKMLRKRCKDKRPGDLLFPSTEGYVWRENNLRRRHWLPAVAEAQRCAEHPPALPPKPKAGPRRKLRPDEVSTCACPGRLKRAPRLHDGRHTHVSQLISEGWDLFKIQRRLGHQSYSTTVNIYGHLDKSNDAANLDALDRRLAMMHDEQAA
ncbi:tyrosine-type recombinase/integrase [Micromonospora sp. RV43]|uniref:tyrosine-type recombinase/integrase n=1 Tax=Micromonospora sp. RV43 TaxID=1661387 RepID=UPI000A5DFD84|nr:tyrosine-type recombinase/integrase [Micromonospora sp. RV43]